MKDIVVIDLNVFVRALLGSSADKAIYEAIKTERFILAFCPDMLENLAKVLIRSHLKLEITDIKELLGIIKTKAIIVKPEIKIKICRDASDNIVLETAIAAKANTVVTNDKDLLVLNPFKGFPVITSKEFLKRLRKG